MDFTLNRYKEIIETFKKGGYSFFTFERFIREAPTGRVIILRHDVDRFPKRCLALARLEMEMDVTATYYFRTKKGVFDPQVIEELVISGHEVGYHYEDLTIAKGNFEKALHLFGIHLGKLRNFYPVSTICMHGNPLSKFDNKSIWKKYDYREFGIIGEPYLDVNYENVLYITDTGRRWNDNTVNIKDRIEGLKTGRIKSSKIFLDWVQSEQINDKIILNIHPDRWHSNYIFWGFDFVFQSFKNWFKALINQFSG